jgi:hypothetical protein
MRFLVAITVVVSLGLVPAGCGSASRVLVGHRTCPPRDLTFASSPEVATRTVLVPGDPEAVLVCRYWGRRDTGRSQSLAGERQVLSGVKLRSFVRRLNALPPIPKDPPPSCPVFDGRSLLLLFRYHEAPDDPVQIVRSGCTPVSNGHLRERFGEGLVLGSHWPDEGVL